jgi:hypothetical protein
MNVFKPRAQEEVADVDSDPSGNEALR